MLMRIIGLYAHRDCGKSEALNEIEGLYFAVTYRWSHSGEVQDLHTLLSIIFVSLIWIDCLVYDAFY